MGIGGVIVTVIACAVALIVLPAVLALLGTRVNALAPRWMQRGEERQATGGWYRLSRAVARRPATIAIATAATLVALALPLGGLNVTAVDASVLPQDRSARQVHEALEHEFPPHQTTPVSLVLETGSRPDAERFLERVRSLPGTQAVSPPRPVGDGAFLADVVARAAPYGDAGQAFVREVRGLQAPFGVEVGGQASAFHDLLDSLAAHAPAALLILLGATTILLFLFTGSVLIPLVSLVMNVLALGATFGVLTWIFQDGRLEGLLGYTSQGALETTMPLVILTQAFGLSTDYGVFLLSRIKEARDGGASDGEAVAVGLERVGRIATAAALLFCVAVGAFLTSEMVFIKQLGLGTALAVIIDATIVRALLVPSLLALLGRRAWWAPRPLRRLHARLGLGHEEQPQPASA
jgi:RND superfamily putative drug exporter